MLSEVDASLVKDALQRTAALTNDLSIVREEVQLCSRALAEADIDVDANDALLDVMCARQPLVSQLLDLDAADVAFALISEIPSAKDGDDFFRDMLYRWLIEGLMLRHQAQVANQVAEQAFATNGYELFKVRLRICEFDSSAEHVEAARRALPRAVAATKLCVTNPPIF